MSRVLAKVRGSDMTIHARLELMDELARAHGCAVMWRMSRSGRWVIYERSGR